MPSGRHETRSLILAKLRSLDGAAKQPGKMLNHPVARTKAGAPTEAGVYWELCYDSTNNDVYINTDGSTTWAKILD